MEGVHNSTPPLPPPTTTLAHLDPEHLRVMKNVLSDIIATEQADDVFAQLVDGIPTRPTFQEHFQEPPLLDSILKREKPSEESVKLVRAFRQGLDISCIQLDSKIVQSYQNAPLGSWQFELRLLELVAVAANALAGVIYSNSHPDTILHPRDPGFFQPPHYYLDFYHGAYRLYQDYPYGVLNMVGYWMETRIFGGVLLVEHDDSDREARNVFVHTQWSGTFQLSESQVHRFSQPFCTEPRLDRVKTEDILPFQPEKGVRSLIRNQLQAFHVFRDQFSRIYPFWPAPIRCVRPMTDEDREIIKWGLEHSIITNPMAKTNSQRRNQDDPHKPDYSPNSPKI